MANICRCALDIGGTLAKIVFVLHPDSDDDQLIPGDHELDLNTEDERLKSWWKGDEDGISDHGEQHQPSDTLDSNRQRTAAANTSKDDVRGRHTELTQESQPPMQQPQQKQHQRRDQLILRFHFFHTKDVDKLIASLQENNIVPSGSVLPVTGGGAFKFHETLKSKLGVRILKLDEMLSAMTGLSFLSRQSNEVYQHDLLLRQRLPKNLVDPIEPFLLVNIGSGVSILKAEGPGQFARVTGTCIGGGTVMGLARLLIGATSFQEVVTLAEHGTNCLDLNVGDLFGDTAGSRCLPGNTLASSFGRLYVGPDKNQIHTRDIRREDVARSLVNMVSYNLGYLAYLIGIIHNIRRIFFAGKYINNHIVTMEAIAHAVDFYTQHYHHRRHLDTIVPSKGPTVSISCQRDADLSKTLDDKNRNATTSPMGEQTASQLNSKNGVQPKWTDTEDQTPQAPSSPITYNPYLTLSRTQSGFIEKLPEVQHVSPATHQLPNLPEASTFAPTDHHSCKDTPDTSTNTNQVYPTAPPPLLVNGRKESDLVPFSSLCHHCLGDGTSADPTLPASPTPSPALQSLRGRGLSSVIGRLPSQDLSAQLSSLLFSANQTSPIVKWDTQEESLELHHRYHSLKNPSMEQDKFEVLSLRHDGYLGALGALLLAAENIAKQQQQPS